MKIQSTVLFSTVLLMTSVSALGISTVNVNNWTMFRHDATHTGVAEGPVPMNEIIWKYKTRGFSYPPFMWHSSPAIVDNTIFVGSLDFYVYALDATTGQLKWEFKTGSWVDSSPAVYQGKVYVGSWDSYVYCINAFNGNLIWKYPTGNRIISSPTVVDGRVFIGSGDGYLYSLNASTGELIWRYRASDFGVESSPAVSDGIVVVGSHGWYAEGRIYALNETNGDVLWSYQTVSDIHSSPAIVDGTVYIGGGTNGLQPILALDLFTGNKLWSYSISAFTPASPAVKNGRLFINSFDGNVYSLNTINGELLWTYNRGVSIRWETSPAVVDGAVIIGSEDGYLYWLNESDGSLIRKIEVGSPIMSSPSVSNGKVYFSTDDGYIYSVGSLPKVVQKLFVKLSGEFDYSSKEDVKIRLAALVRDSESLEPVSNASVTIKLYYPNGTLWVSDNMVEKLIGTGIYNWESSKTIRQMNLIDGVYLVYAKASINNGPVAFDILEFHIDRPQEEPILSVSPIVYYAVTVATALAGISGAIYVLRKRSLKSQETKHLIKTS